MTMAKASIHYILKNSKKLRELKIVHYNESISRFFDITKIAHLQCKNADDSKTKGVSQVIYMGFRYSLCKV